MPDLIHDITVETPLKTFETLLGFVSPLCSEIESFEYAVSTQN